MATAALLKSTPGEGMVLLEAQAAAHTVQLGRLKSAAQCAGRGVNSDAGTAAMAVFAAAVDTYMPGAATPLS